MSSDPTSNEPTTPDEENTSQENKMESILSKPISDKAPPLPEPLRDESIELAGGIGDWLKRRRDKSASTGDVVANHGQIGSMSLPKEWKELTRNADDETLASAKEFSPKGAPDVKMCLYFRGYPTSEEAGKNFKDVLSHPAHNLNAEEIGKLGETLDVLANKDAFDISSAKTEDIRGRRVLNVSGTFKESGKQYQGIFIDADGTGSAVQEVYVEGKESFKDYAPQARKSIESLRWK